MIEQIWDPMPVCVAMARFGFGILRLVVCQGAKALAKAVEIDRMNEVALHIVAQRVLTARQQVLEGRIGVMDDILRVENLHGNRRIIKKRLKGGEFRRGRKTSG